MGILIPKRSIIFLTGHQLALAQVWAPSGWLVFLICSVLSIVWYGYFYCICALHIVVNNDILQRVIYFVLSPRMVSASCRHSRTTSIQTTPLPNTLLCMRSKCPFFHSTIKIYDVCSLLVTCWRRTLIVHNMILAAVAQLAVHICLLWITSQIVLVGSSLLTQMRTRQEWNCPVSTPTGHH